MVRDALLTSVTCVFLAVKFHINQLSIVPKANFPALAFSLAPATFSRIHFTLVAEKYESIINPVLSCIFFAKPCFLISSQ